MPLINWLWLEDLLIRAAEGEIRAFAEAHPDETFYAFCLEYDAAAGELAFSYGMRADVERAIQRDAPNLQEPVCYREVELSPRVWTYAEQPILDQDPAGPWGLAAPIVAEIHKEITGGESPEVIEFYWLRFEYLAESVVQRLIERDAFRPLRKETEFIAFAANEIEGSEEIEDRLVKLYPHYNRATVEWAEHARPSDVHAELVELFEQMADEESSESHPALRRRVCQSGKCARHPAPRSVMRCTYCQRWFCETCQDEHVHPELSARQSLFAP